MLVGDTFLRAQRRSDQLLAFRLVMSLVPACSAMSDLPDSLVAKLGAVYNGSVAPGDNFIDRDRFSRYHHQYCSVTKGPTTRPALSSPA